MKMGHSSNRLSSGVSRRVENVLTCDRDAKVGVSDFAINFLPSGFPARLNICSQIACKLYTMGVQEKDSPCFGSSNLNS